MKLPLPPPRAKQLALVAAVAVVYYVAARFSLLLAFEKTNASPVWPPSGLAFAAMLLLGRGIWPGILLGAFLANVGTFLANQATNPWTVLPVSAFIAIGNTLEALLGISLISRLGIAENPLDRVQDVFKFVAVTLLMCLVSPCIGPTALMAAGMAPWLLYGTIWFTWWMGDAGGVLVVTPLILSWTAKPVVKWTSRQLVEIGCLVLLLILAGRLALGGWPLPRSANYPLSFLIIPPLMWATLRFGRRGATSAVVLIAGIAVREATRGFGPFVRESVNESLLLLQAFIGVVTVTMLVMAAIVAERNRAAQRLKEVNISLKQRAEELSRSNAELERFAYVASHDLQEPLRIVASYVQLLETRYKGRLDEKADKFIYYAADGAKRMQMLIRDLLRYSRVGRSEAECQPVSCGKALAGAISNLKLSIEEARARIACDPLPIVLADSSQITRLFQNLLENALKFRSEAIPTIRVTASRMGKEWVISVADNGIGLDPVHSERVFQVFQRLHDRSKYSGTGIGLAIAKKIVERYGGRIWVESEPGKGATFRFTLQAAHGYEVVRC